MVSLAASSGVAIATATLDSVDLEKVTSADISAAHDDYFTDESSETVTVLARTMAEGFLKFSADPAFYNHDPAGYTGLATASSVSITEIRPRKDKIEAKATVLHSTGKETTHMVVALVSTGYQITPSWCFYQEGLQALFDSQTL